MPDLDDIDPEAAQTVEEFAQCLRRLRARAGNPSLRDLEQWARQHQRQLPRSSVSNALAGKWLPRRDLVLDLLRACGTSPQADLRWIRAWTRLAETTDSASPSTSLQATAFQAGLVGAEALAEAERLLADATKAHQAAERQIAERRAAAQQEIDTLLAQAQRIRQDAQLDDQLARDVRAAGLRRIGSTYLTEMAWKGLFTDIAELDIFMAYGQTWLHLHARELAMVAARPGSRIRVFLADPDDHLTMTALAARFTTTDSDLKARIDATRREYDELRSPGGADIQIFYWPGDRTFSFFRLDKTAVISFYSHSKSRAASVPVFLCQEPGELYQFVLDELQAIQESSRLA